eukprot:1297145-Rhodomonas_salina.1
MEPEDRACGTWWHSVLPSMDPVALTWKRKETAENKEEQSNVWNPRLSRVYSDMQLKCPMSRST